MSRIQDILINVRDILADTEKTRWSDDALIRLLNIGVKDFVLATECIKEKLYIELEPGVHTYDISQYVLKFIRVQYMDKDISVKTHMELDKINSEWQLTTDTTIQYCVFDHLKSGSIRVYPTPSGTSIITQNSLYGGLIDIIVQDNELLTSLSNVGENMHDYLICYIVKKPSILTINTLDADFELDSIYDRALEYFISGNAFRMDADTINRQFGAEQIQLYSQYVNACIASVSLSSSAVLTREIPYRGFQ